MEIIRSNSFDNNEINYHREVIKWKLIISLSIVEIPRIIWIKNARYWFILAAVPSDSIRPILLFVYCLELGIPKVWFSSTFDK
jgi:TctA family transporter